MGIFGSDLAEEHKIKKRVDKLKRELADLTGNHRMSRMFDMGMQGGRLIHAMRSKGHDALDTVSDQMYGFRKKVKRNPALTVAILAGVSAVTAMFISAAKRY